MTDAVTTTLATLGVVGQLVAVVLVVVVLLHILGVRGPLESTRAFLWGYELWLAFVVAAIATAGSLFFSEYAGYVPCELCWFQRIFMYPLAVVLPFAAARNDYRITPYLLPLPLIGAGFAGYHLLVERGLVEQTQGCLISAPGGCAVRWIEEFGYVTIPVLALTSFVLAFAFLGLAALDGSSDDDEGERSSPG